MCKREINVAVIRPPVGKQQGKPSDVVDLFCQGAIDQAKSRFA